jgi:predicted dehydrogenase
MPDDKIRIGIIGANANYGWSMRAHLPALLALPEYELTAVCTSSAATAAESAKAYGARLPFHDYREMVAHPDIDLVSVSVRVPLHHDMVIAALEAEKHVFCEWPLGANLGEAQEMASLARSKGVTNMVGLQARGAPAILHLKELISQGYVGEVLACNMTMFLPGVLQRGLSMPWMADREKGGNTLTIGTGHAIDALCFCVGEFKEISAKVATQVREWEIAEPGKTVPVNSADNVLISGTLVGGGVASAHVATIPWHGTGWRMEVYGREGTLTASSQEMIQYGNITIRGAHGGETQLAEVPIPAALTHIPGEVPLGAPFNVAQIYRSLGQAIKDGKGAMPDFDFAVDRHKLLAAMEQSSNADGKAVAL